MKDVRERPKAKPSDWWYRLETTAPAMPHEGPLDHIELGDKAASMITNENRDGWGAWIDPDIFELQGSLDVIPIETTADLTRARVFMPKQRKSQENRDVASASR